MERFLGYFRFSFRQLRKSPSFAIAAVLTLALGIGATTAIFSLVNAVLLKPLPFPEPDRLMRITQEDHSAGAVVPESLSYPDYFDWRTQNRTFSGMASYTGRNLTLTGVGQAAQVGVYVTSSNFFQVLGVAPMLGRDFRWDEERPGNRALMLSAELWQSRFGGDREIVGRQVTLDGERYTVAGVMPQGFHFPTESAVEAWISLAVEGEGIDPATHQRGQDGIEVIGRLKPGVSVEQAKADLSSVARGLAAQYSDTNKWYTTARVLPQLEFEVGKTRPALEVLFGAVALVLLIACVNVAGLLLVRSSRRSGEIALRSALGASRSEIVWQLLTESVVLSLISGLAGIVLASGALKELAVLFPQALPRLKDVSIDLPVLAFAIGVSVVTGILFGVVPALRISRLAPALALRDGTRTVTSGRAHHRLQTWLVIGETALGLVLLVGAGLLIRSFVSVLRVDPGFDAHHVLTARVTMGDVTYTHDRKIQFVEELTRRLNALPGVKSA
jgi:predicted permease